MLVALVVGLLTTSNAAAGEGRGTLTGTVVDAKTGAPVAGATVGVGSPALPKLLQAVTVANGTFTVKDLPAGPYVLVISHNGHGTERVMATVLADRVARVEVQLLAVGASPSPPSTPGTNAAAAPALAPGTGGVGGFIVDAATRAPLAGVAVTVASPSAPQNFVRIATDARGAFGVLDMPPGPYVVSLSLPGYATVRQTVTVKAGLVSAGTAELTADRQVAGAANAPEVTRPDLPPSAGEGRDTPRPSEAPARAPEDLAATPRGSYSAFDPPLSGEDEARARGTYTGWLVRYYGTDDKLYTADYSTAAYMFIGAAVLLGGAGALAYLDSEMQAGMEENGEDPSTRSMAPTALAAVAGIGAAVLVACGLGEIMSESEAEDESQLPRWDVGLGFGATGGGATLTGAF